MNFKKYLLLIIACLLSVASGHTETWRYHFPYTGSTNRILDTPELTYFLINQQEQLEGVEFNMNPCLGLVRYDKTKKELTPLTGWDELSDLVIVSANYNYEKNYLMIAYDNGNIDLLYDNGEVKNIKSFMSAGSEYDKRVNGIHFFADANQAYLATNFGYFVINDKTLEIESSRNFGQTILGATRFGDNILIATEKNLLSTGLNSHALLKDMNKITECEKFHGFYPVGSRLYFWHGPKEEWSGQISFVTNGGDGNLVLDKWMNSRLVSVELRKNALQASAPDMVWCIDSDLKVDGFSRLAGESGRNMVGWADLDFWIDNGKEGWLYRRMSRGEDGSTIWTPISEPLSYSGPSTMRAGTMTWHPTYGMLVRNIGTTPGFPLRDLFNPDMLCSYSKMEWTPKSGTWHLGGYGLNQSHPTGIVIDPLDNDIVYSGSVFNGMLRIDLKDVDKSYKIAHSGDWGNGDSHLIPYFSTPEGWTVACPVYVPSFDSQGNMWSVWYDYTAETKKDKVDRFKIFFWSAEDRRASKDGATFVAPKMWVVPGFTQSISGGIHTFKSKGLENVIGYRSGIWNSTFATIDTNGTPGDPTDDVVTIPTQMVDQDGKVLSEFFMNCMYEDVLNRRIWFGTNSGVFYIEADKLLKEPGTIRKIKVSRNDGTNLADYLLDGVDVVDICQDVSGNMWFSTRGAGLVTTTSDGGTVIKTYTTDNSGIPDNRLSVAQYNPENHSMMVSTDKGLAELFLSTGTSGGGTAELKAYPNPVAPDFYGYVRIEGLADNALVKVVDVRGNLVRELDKPTAGEATWDLTDLTMKRVRGGVYYILASGGTEGDAYSAVTKILVIE